jgi:hypothetical protein
VPALKSPCRVEILICTNHSPWSKNQVPISTDGRDRQQTTYSNGQPLDPQSQNPPIGTLAQIKVTLFVLKSGQTVIAPVYANCLVLKGVAANLVARLENSD